jgi:predicted metal-binding membrane protein
MARAISRRERAGIWATLGLAAVVGWTQLVAGDQMSEGMDAGLFLSMWFWMVGAMMLPPLAPVVTAGAELLLQVPAATRLLRLALFVLAYLGLWSIAGFAAVTARQLSTGRPVLVAGLVGLAGL